MKYPSSVGLPSDKFPYWRKGQDRALRELLFGKDRFQLLCIPTGGGKSAIYMGRVGVDDERALVLTATLALQDQNMANFEEMGLADVRGRSNYVCDTDNEVNADEGVCTVGIYCPLMKRGCEYYDRKREAGDSRLAQTNYRFWLHDEESESLGHFPTLILDEAHRAPDEISDYAAVEVSDKELAGFGVDKPRWGVRPDTWASRALMVLDGAMTSKMGFERRKKGLTLQRKLARLCRLSDQAWLPSKPSRDRWRWDLVDPGALAEDLLFRGAEHVILSSASVRRKTLQLLGVDGKVKVIEQSSTFPVNRRPIYYWPLASVGRKMTGQQGDVLYRGMDRWMSPRLDRNGVIHCHSFEFGQAIYNRSQHRGRMILHHQGEKGAAVFQRFVKEGKRRPTILVSPSFATGTDFAYTLAEWQIIPKMPFPSFVSPLVKARAQHDKDYVPYVTWQTMVQAAGRPMRAEDDQGETLIPDSNFGWMRSAHWDFAPGWFHNAVRTISKDREPPPPPPPL